MSWLDGVLHLQPKTPPNKKRPRRQQTSPAIKNRLRDKIGLSISRGVLFIGRVSRTPPLIKSLEKDPASLSSLLSVFLPSSLPLSPSLLLSVAYSFPMYVFSLCPNYVSLSLSLSSVSLLFLLFLSFSLTHAKCRPSDSTQIKNEKFTICCRFR